MKTLKRMTDEELQREYRTTFHSIEVVECFSAKDVLRLESLGRELERRHIHIIPDISFEQEEK